MTPRKEGFLAALISLWMRLSTVAIIALFFFFVTVILPGRLTGWSFYMTAAEEVFETLVFALYTALAGLAFGAICTALVAPFLLFGQSSRRRIVDVATKTAVAIAAFLDLSLALKLILQWANIWGRPKAAIFAAYFIVFALCLIIPRRRKQLVTSLDTYLSEGATRRAVLGTGAAAAVLAVAEAAMARVGDPPAAPRGVARPSGPNILLVTFDALCAEDMSLYGYRLPTTPRIDEFAGKSSVFSNAYSGSTFTTSCVATMLTGLQPSEHHVYHLTGPFRGNSAEKTLPRLMRAGGYTTGASISNPFAYFLNQALAADYDFFPEPAYRTGGYMRLWDALGPLHQRQPFGSRADEFWDLEKILDSGPSELEVRSARLFGRTKSRFPPVRSFQQAQDILNQMPDGFFLWVHLFAPHQPYLPSPPNLGRFLPTNEMRTESQQYPYPFPWNRYQTGEQGMIDKARLRYNEFLAEADSAFGVFLTGLEGAGKLRNTAVIVGADHGESFEGGLYTHGSKYQTRPEIHIPLMIRTPGQERGSRVAVTVDQTSMAPTILDLAGLPRAEWMHGPSLIPWLNRNGEGEGQGLAFTQYLEIDSIFKPLNYGTVGVVDGRHQYVLDLGTGKGILRGLDEAQSWDLDRSAENPTLAQTLRDAIYARFPDLPRRTA